MKANRTAKAFAAACACAIALVAVVGCGGSAASSSSAQDGSANASASASAASASSSSSSEAASASASSASASSAADATQAAIEDALKDGYQVFEGTVHVVDAAALVELQGADIDPAVAGNGGTYAVLVFDSPADVVGMSADGSGERTETANMLGVAELTKYDSFVVEYGDLDTWKPLDGQRAVVAAKSADIMFPSDVRLPIGEPEANVSKLLS